MASLAPAAAVAARPGVSVPSLRFLGRDLTASIVVFLVAMPLCMGIAIASGVPAEKGLITGIIGGIVVGVAALIGIKAYNGRKRKSELKELQKLLARR